MTPQPPPPLHCRPEAFTALAHELEALHTTRGLVRCAVAVSMHALTDTDPDAVERQIDELSATVAERVTNPQPRALLAHAHAVLFDEAEFRGNTKDYYSPDNSFLSRILETRQGLPITLTLLYKAVLENLGLKVSGINAPGHFLAGLVEDDGRPPLLIDPFERGRMMTRDEAFARIEQVAGGAVARDERLLRPATHPQWLGRILQNLVNAYDRLNRPADRAAMTELHSLLESAD
jgi:regulator of sirC expression with transglutaminase-like and TPR domain